MTVAPVLRAAHVRQTPAEAFRLFTDQIGAWWPLPTHGLFAGRAGGVAFEDGRLVERSVAGERTVWAEVVAWEPPHRIVLAWHPGHDDGPHSEVEVTFVGHGDGTRVELVHRGWDGFGETALAARGSYIGPSAWGFVLDHYADVADRDAHAAAADALDALVSAYDAFFAEALAGGFDAPPAGEWTAERVAAHVAMNDDAMAAVCRALIKGDTPTFGNEPCHDAAVLDALINGAGGTMAGVVAVGRARATTLRLLLGRLDEDQLARVVAAYLTDHGNVVLDAAVPWGKLALATQTGFHLPLHTEQLRSLRGG